MGSYKYYPSDQLKSEEIKSQFSLGDVFDLMEKALNQVDKKYVVDYHPTQDDNDGASDNIGGLRRAEITENCCATNKEKKDSLIKQVERCFAYELYHQLRKIVEGDKVFYKDIEINAEVPKVCLSDTYPDLVIHGGQTNKDPKMQLLVGEIKRNTNKFEPNEDVIKADLLKLGKYICTLQHDNGPIGFQCGCFIMTDVSNLLLREVVEKIMRKSDVSFQADGKVIQLKEIANRITVYSYEVKYNEDGKSIGFLVDKFSLGDVLNCQL